MTRQKKAQYTPELRRQYEEAYAATRELLHELKRALDAYDKARATGKDTPEIAGAALTVTMDVDRAFEAIPRHLATVLHVDHDQPWVTIAEYAGQDTGPAAYSRFGIASTGERKREADRRLRLKRSHKNAAEKGFRWMPALYGHSSSTASKELGCSYVTANAMGRRGDILRVHFADKDGIPLVGPGSSPDRYFLDGVPLEEAKKVLAEHPEWTGELLSAPVLDENRRRVPAKGGGDLMQYFPKLSRFERIERTEKDEQGNSVEPTFMLVVPDDELEKLAAGEVPEL